MAEEKKQEDEYVIVIEEDEKKELNKLNRALSCSENEIVTNELNLLVKKTKKIKYAIPSKIKLDAKKIYKLMDISYSTTPYIIGKL